MVISLADEDGYDPGYDQMAYKILELIKGREGETGKIKLSFDMMRTRIEQDSVLMGDSDLLGNEEPEHDDQELEQNGNS